MTKPADHGRRGLLRAALAGSVGSAGSFAPARSADATSLAATAGSAGAGAAAARPAARSAAARGTGWVFDDRFLTPIFEPPHPEQPGRVQAILQALAADPIRERLTRIRAVTDDQAIDEAIGRLHSRQHVRSITAGYRSDIVQAARAGVGAALAGVDAVFVGVDGASTPGRLRNAFVCSRPPGHHARDTGREEGFCFFNNVAIAVRHAQARYRCRRVLIVDWDYHHGNGTEHFFYEDGSVLLFNTYDPDAYPRSGDAARTGAGAGAGLNLNLPMRCGAGDEAFVPAFARQLAPAADRFRPDLVLISAGFDSRVDDTLGCFRITDAGYAQMTGIVMDIARRHCGGRLVSVLEGGYRLPGLASAVMTHVRTLLTHR